MTDMLTPIALASRCRSAIHDVGAPDSQGDAAVQLEYKTKVLKFTDGTGFDNQYLKDATDPNSSGEDYWEIFAVFPLDGKDEKYRLFMRREKPRK